MKRPNSETTKPEFLDPAQLDTANAGKFTDWDDGGLDVPFAGALEEFIDNTMKLK